MSTILFVLLIASCSHLTFAASSTDANKITVDLLRKIETATKSKDNALFFSTMDPSLTVSLCGKTINFTSFQKFGKLQNDDQNKRLVTIVSTSITPSGYLQSVVSIKDKTSGKIYGLQIQAQNKAGTYKIVKLTFVNTPNCDELLESGLIRGRKVLPVIVVAAAELAVQTAVVTAVATVTSHILNWAIDFFG
ncbi:unnamed protein product [Caenorhabditis angaria]|uniref:Uncharacterized protein n=1 Tax=Caenorhabditis angaria TaxID=860376 RepID=A0A9P1IFZ6_9PELO|nr:unnamed protein product [Caenorhabditis angaria]